MPGNSTIGPPVGRGRRSRGMTLIEIMVVLGVLSLMVGTVIVGFGAGRSAEVNKAVTQLANTIRYGYDKARVTGLYYRLEVNLDEGTFTLQAAEDAMYLPATDRNGEPYERDERDVEERDERDKQAADQYYRSVQAQVYEQSGDELDPYAVETREVPRRRPPLFESFEDENSLSGLVDPVVLPEGLKVVYVRTAEDLDPITEGTAALYFFPQGRTQLAHIQIKEEDREIEYTIKVQPLTGRVTISDELEALTLPDDPEDMEDELGKRRQRRTF